jgi:hypothetical protein
LTLSKVDLDEVENLATQVRRAQSSLDAGVQGFSAAPSPALAPAPRLTGNALSVQMGPTLPHASAFGNTSGGLACLSAHAGARSTMDATLKAFAATVDSDAERLELAVALYRKTDAENADRMLEINRNRLDVITAQLTTNEKHAHEAQQAAEIEALRRLAGDETAGNTVVTGDFNAGPNASTGVRNFERNGLDVHGGDIHDGVGGTSLKHRPIDYVMPRGVGAAEARRWDRDPSDHDGQVVDLTMPYW